jgi:uncharacterized membrane protein YkvA (DUF1232 family)
VADVGYLALPIDLIPDFIPDLGYADDAIAVAIGLRTVTRQAGAGALTRHWPGTEDGLNVVRRLAGLPAETAQYHQTDAELITYLRYMGGTPDEVLDSPAFMRHYLGCLRADLILGEQYRYPGPANLDCPITVFAGRGDTVAGSETLPAWQEETRHPLRTLASPRTSARNRMHMPSDGVPLELCF